MNKKIKIGKVYIKKAKSDVLGNAVRLCANVTMENPNTRKVETKECFFEFEERYEKFLCDERSDAFVSGLLSTAMENDMDIEFVTPISERLYYNLSNYYIPIVAKNNSFYPMNNIKLNGPTDSTIIKNERAVATGCSGGVDSFYTIAKHSKGKTTKENELTHLVYNSLAFDADSREENIKKVFKKTKNEMEKVAKECCLDLIACYSNLNEFYTYPYKSFNTFYAPVHISVIFALQKLISIYYLSSTVSIYDFHLDIIKIHDSSAFDLFTLSCLANENLNFYSTGMECERIDKQEYIADFKPAQKYLSVCALTSFYDNLSEKDLNCSNCKKCLRTMCQFYAIGKLENFSEVFNVENFFKHKSKYIGKFLGIDTKCFVREFKAKMKENKIKIPIKSYLYAYLWYMPLSFFRKKLSHSMLARKIYYKLNLDYKLDGFRGQHYDYYMEKLNKK